MAEKESITASNSYLEEELRRRLISIEDCTGSDVFVCICPILPPADDWVRNQIEDITSKREKLLVILETDGGSIETTERIADVMRYHYPHEVAFLVPNFAMSAGTILVMSGDRILMDYYSVLGPIDPQVKATNGNTVPALGYIEQFKS